MQKIKVLIFSHVNKSRDAPPPLLSLVFFKLQKNMKQLLAGISLEKKYWGFCYSQEVKREVDETVWLPITCYSNFHVQMCA